MEIKGCDKKEANKIRDSINRCYAEDITLGPLKVIQMEGLLSRELLGDMARYVFNNYEWSDKLDSEVDRIVLEYRTKGELGRKKPSVKRALYTALAMGLQPEWYRRFDSVTGCQSVKYTNFSGLDTFLILFRHEQADRPCSKQTQQI